MSSVCVCVCVRVHVCVWECVYLWHWPQRPMHSVCQASCIIVRGWPSGDGVSSHPLLGACLSPSFPPNEKHTQSEMRDCPASNGVVEKNSTALGVCFDMHEHARISSKPMTEGNYQSHSIAYRPQRKSVSAKAIKQTIFLWQNSLKSHICFNCTLFNLNQYVYCVSSQWVIPWQLPIRACLVESLLSTHEQAFVLPCNIQKPRTEPDCLGLLGWERERERERENKHGS